MSKLDHPACPRAYACGRDAENVYIAYAYVPGATFRESLRARGGLALARDDLESDVEAVLLVAREPDRARAAAPERPHRAVAAEEETGLGT